MTEIPDINPDASDETILDAPDITVDAREVFGVDVDMQIPALSVKDERVPELDLSYVFDPETTITILSGFAFNRRAMVHGYHGPGKSTHLDNLAARPNRRGPARPALEPRIRVPYKECQSTGVVQW